MSDEKIVHVINKRNRAVFAVPLQEAKDLMDNFDGLLETQEELPLEPEKAETPDELKILGGQAQTEETAMDKVMPANNEAPKAQETLPEEPKPETEKTAIIENKVKATAK